MNDELYEVFDEQWKKLHTTLMQAITDTMTQRDHYTIKQLYYAEEALKSVLDRFHVAKERAGRTAPV